MKSFSICALEPFFGGSHKQFLSGLLTHSKHSIELLTLPPENWRKRMHTSALYFANILNSMQNIPDCLFCCDYVNIAELKGLLTESYNNVPIIVYFHENQLTYPQKNNEISFSLPLQNIISVLGADYVWFNSYYHKNSFYSSISDFINSLGLSTLSIDLDSLEKKTSVVYLGIDLAKIDTIGPARYEKTEKIRLLWNHRWEYDKNFPDFYNALIALKEKNIDFELVLCGSAPETIGSIFLKAEKMFSNELIHFGTIPSYEDYIRVIKSCDVVISTANHDFFGISVVEAIYCGCYPLLPNRLAYPEHIPDNILNTHLCDDESDFINKLEFLANNVETARKTNLINAVKKYDWSSQIVEFDTAFEKVVLDAKEKI